MNRPTKHHLRNTITMKRNYLIPTMFLMLALSCTGKSGNAAISAGRFSRYILRFYMFPIWCTRSGMSGGWRQSSEGIAFGQNPCAFDPVFARDSENPAENVLSP